MATGSADFLRSDPGLRGARPGGLRVLERVLWVTGSLALGWCVFVISASRIDRFLGGRLLDRSHASRSSDPAAVSNPRPAAGQTMESRPAIAPLAPLVRGALIGRLEIATIGLSAVAREGDDARTLRFSVGHIPGTPVPPEEGNAAFAGHRDRQFRGLGRVRPNDEIRITTESGEFVYRVEWTSVVGPDASWVLDPTPDATLTLVTCYPFGYVGSAPDRFVVRAKLVAS